MGTKKLWPVDEVFQAWYGYLVLTTTRTSTIHLVDDTWTTGTHEASVGSV